jgi:hypothetical protein
MFNKEVQILCNSKRLNHGITHYLYIKQNNFLLMSPGLVVREEYVFKSDAAKIRTHMSCQAALLLLFTITSTLQGEETTTAIQLRCDLIGILVNAATTTPSTAFIYT